jgi:two-component system sensor histidine kinase BarA
VSAGARPTSSSAVDREGLLDGKRCLAADDHAINLQLITHLLRDMGADVLEARDGDEAVQLTMENDIDMIFLDVHMPRMNGLEAARRIEALHAGHPIPIIALTADAEEKNQREIGRAGIQRYLIKPVNEEELRQVVSDVLSGRFETKFFSAAAQTPSAHDWPIRDQAQALRIAGGSASIAAKLFGELRAELPATIASLRNQLEKRDWSELWQLSHRLHGAAAVCGVPALYHALGELQPAITLEDEAAVSALLERVAREAQRVTELDK